MLFPILDRVLGVELTLQTENKFTCSFCLVTKQKNLVNIKNCKRIEGTLSEILVELPQNYPIALTLTGKGIIAKNIQLRANEDIDKIFQQAFPGVDHNDFYLQQFNNQQNALLNIARKQGVDDVLDKMQRAGRKIYSLSLGAIVTATIWPQLNIYGQDIQFDGHLFLVDSEQAFLSYKSDDLFHSKFPIKVAETPIEETNLIAYACAFQLLLHGQLVLIQVGVQTINIRFTNFILDSKLKNRGVIFLYAICAALMISFITFVYYNDQNIALAQKVGSKTTNIDQTKHMRSNIGENEAKLRQLNWNGGYNYGFILNEIGLEMPKQLTLTEVAMNEFKTDKEKTDRVPSIGILGSTESPVSLNNWIFVLKGKTWVKSVQLLEFQEEPGDGKYHFNLRVTY